MTVNEYLGREAMGRMGYERPITDDELNAMKQSLIDKYGHTEEIAQLVTMLSNRNDSQQLTCGNYEKEADAESAFDNAINSDFFVIEKEVEGRRLFDDKAVSVDGQRVRIDRVIHPTDKAVKSGWQHGPIGIEIKKSGVKLGPVFAQVLEYRQSIFLSRLLANTRIMPKFFSIFPTKSLQFDLHSIQNSQYILSCHINNWDKTIKFSTSNDNVLEFNAKIFEAKKFNPTLRKGHRG